MKLTELLLLFSSLALTFLGFSFMAIQPELKEGLNAPYLKNGKHYFNRTAFFENLLLNYFQTGENWSEFGTFVLEVLLFQFSKTEGVECSTFSLQKNSSHIIEPSFLVIRGFFYLKILCDICKKDCLAQYRVTNTQLKIGSLLVISVGNTQDRRLQIWRDQKN